MDSSPLKVPEQVTFEQAIDLTESLLFQVEGGEREDSETAAVIGDLVKTENGARGFFVTYLTSEVSIADNPSKPIVQALRSHPEVVAELLVKNLAMSSAQAVFHRRNEKEEMAKGSERVCKRTARLIELVELPSVYERSQKLLETIATGEGSYKAFLERWGYDAEQRQVIAQALKQVISEPRWRLKSKVKSQKNAIALVAGASSATVAREGGFMRTSKVVEKKNIF